jgi:hypothetical protein
VEYLEKMSVSTYLDMATLSIGAYLWLPVVLTLDRVQAVGFHNSYQQEPKIHSPNPTQGPHQKCPDQLKMHGWAIRKILPE